MFDDDNFFWFKKLFNSQSSVDFQVISWVCMGVEGRGLMSPSMCRSSFPSATKQQPNKPHNQTNHTARHNTLKINYQPKVRRRRRKETLPWLWCIRFFSIPPPASKHHQPCQKGTCVVRVERHGRLRKTAHRNFGWSFWVKQTNGPLNLFEWCKGNCFPNKSSGGGKPVSHENHIETTCLKFRLDVTWKHAFTTSIQIIVSLFPGVIVRGSYILSQSSTFMAVQRTPVNDHLQIP